MLNSKTAIYAVIIFLTTEVTTNVKFGTATYSCGMLKISNKTYEKLKKLTSSPRNNLGQT